MKPVSMWDGGTRDGGMLLALCLGELFGKNFTLGNIFQVGFMYI